VYRVRQFFDALTAHIDDDDEQVLTGVLTSAQIALFKQMAPNDQRHSLHVCSTLLQSGDGNPELLAAALLHDVGKSTGRIWLWQRTLIVLLQRWAPGVLQWLARGPDEASAPWWRRGFVINRLHPRVGAQWAEKAGCAATTVALIRRHQEPLTSIKSAQDRLLAALQWADGVN
jgi:hypothetical protein